MVRMLVSDGIERNSLSHLGRDKCDCVFIRMKPDRKTPISSNQAKSQAKGHYSNQCKQMFVSIVDWDHSGASLFNASAQNADDLLLYAPGCISGLVKD